MKKRPKLFSIVITLMLCALLGYIEIGVFNEYGWTVFLLIPLLIGFLPPFIKGRISGIDKTECFQLSFTTLIIVILGLLVFAIEGMICILMTIPLAAILVGLGSYLGYKLNNIKKVNTTNSTLSIIALATLFMNFDLHNKPETLIPVTTSVVIDSNIETVWENVVTFDSIPDPHDWIFKTGISYPTHATIEGMGVGAVRYCNFTTGSFVEPITTWNEPFMLAFDVEEQPVPMNEYNPFWDIHPKHLDGYFTSHRGQFKLTEIGANQTQLEGTTWYQVDITPEIYWKSWSDFIIHRIHKRVLNHIKAKSETVLYDNITAN